MGLEKQRGRGPPDNCVCEAQDTALIAILFVVIVDDSLLLMINEQQQHKNDNRVGKRKGTMETSQKRG